MQRWLHPHVYIKGGGNDREGFGKEANVRYCSRTVVMDTLLFSNQAAHLKFPPSKEHLKVVTNEK